MPGDKRSQWVWMGVVLLFTSVISACGNETQNAPPATSSSPTSNPTSPAVDTVEPTDSVDTLSIWLPVFLSPFENNPGGRLLSQRLDEFQASHPDIQIQIRIKEETGPGGLLESLRLTAIAAPSVLPDLVALDAASLRNAVLNDLIIPMNSVYEAPTRPTWYMHALDTVYFAETFFGIPFISQSDVFAYRQSAFQNPPLGWGDLLSGTETFLFPGGDTDSSFTLAQYLSLHGTILDEEGQPSLETNVLRDILEFYSTSERDGLLPLSTLQYVDSRQTWSVLQQIGVSSAVVPLQTFLQDMSTVMYHAQPFPTSDGDGIVLTETYSWSLLTSDDQGQDRAVELIRWLMEPDFLGSWAHSLGMLPATSEALSHWPDEDTIAIVNQLVRVAAPHPNAETVALIGPALRNSIEEVLFRRSTPNAAALMAVEQIENP